MKKIDFRIKYRMDFSKKGRLIAMDEIIVIIADESRIATGR